MSWNTFIEVAPAADHAVQIYDDLAELTTSVGRYFEAGFRVGEPALVIATAEHWQSFAAELESRGWDVDQLQRDALLTCCDAQQVLEQFMDGDVPAPDRFEQVVGAVIDDVAAEFPDTTIRAFGEMVDLLWRRGSEAGAIALEELWNELAEQRRFALLCGYNLDIFDLHVQTNALPEILRTHTHPRTSADMPRFAAAVDQALLEVVGPAEAGQIYLQVAEHVPRTQLPRAQAVLMWLGQQHSATAAKVLDRVRGHYSGRR
jgi:hypothetical protein